MGVDPEVWGHGMVLIRRQQPADALRIREVNTQAFGQPDEANLVDKLRERCQEHVELVAVRGDEIVGHILFSPAAVECEGRTVTGAALGPMAVLPGHQRQGIGAKLVRSGVSILRQKNCPFLVVIGHPEFYPRFGFRPASQFGVQCDWDVPDAAFMMMVLTEEEMRGVRGKVRFRPEFSEV